MNIKDLFKRNKQQPRQQEYVDIKYSKLDHIGKVQRIPIIQKEQVDNIKNDVANNLNSINNINNNVNNINNNITNINNDINSINNKVNKISNDLANANIANYKGIYNNQTNYKLGDLVSDTNTNNIYLSIKDNNINNPLNNNNFWKIITFTVDTSDFVNNTEFQPVKKKLDGLSVHVEQISKKTSFFLTNGVVGNVNILAHSGALVAFQITKIVAGFSLDNRNNDYKAGDWLIDFEFKATFTNGNWVNFIVSKIFKISEFNNNQFFEDILLDKHMVYLTAFNISANYPTITVQSVRGIVN